MPTLSRGVPKYVAVVGAGTIGEAFAIPLPSAALLTWQTIFASAPSACSVELQGSLDDDTWDVLDTSTDTTGEIRDIVISVPFIRVKNISQTGGGDLSIGLSFTQLGVY